MAVYAIKAQIADPAAESFVFVAQKTMYGGRKIAVGDTIYLFDSETSGGRGLVARGVVTTASATPRIEGVERQTPRVSIGVRRTGQAARTLGRSELKDFKAWDDGRPETELNFKFYRQATDKIAGLSEATAALLEAFF